MIKIPKLESRHKDILSMVKVNLPKLFLAMGCMLVISASTAVMAFLVEHVLDGIFVNRDKRMLKLIPAAVLVIFFLRSGSHYLQAVLMNFVGEGIIRQLRDKLYERIQDLPVSFFQDEQTGVLMSRITNDVNIIKGMVTSAVTGSLRDCFTIVGLTFVIFYQDWKMALYAMVVLPVAFFPIVEFGRRVRKVSTGCQEAMADMSSFLHETFFGNKIVKAFGMEDYEKNRFREKTRNLFTLEMKAVKARSLSSPVMEFLGGLGIAFIIWYGGSRVIDGTSTAGTFFSFMTAVLMLYEPVKKLSNMNNTVQQGLAALDRVYDVIERDSDLKERPDPIVIPSGAHRVAFENVALKYDETTALSDISLEVGKGEILALVGTSGGGKTSLVNLIPRFFDVNAGAVKIDGVDVRDASIASLRDQIAIVTQDTILFNNTIRNNIAYGKRDATEQEIINAAKAAYSIDFIESFPNGFDTMIGELGGRLSGGQKQRICIARALLKDAPVLILDEATSALDTESEMLVQKALENLMRGRTTFVIAHRLSTIAYANRIIVISGGRIIEEGTHDDLMDRKGEYHKLYQMQFKQQGASAQ